MQPSAISMSCECKVTSDDISIYIYLHTFDDLNFCSGKDAEAARAKPKATASPKKTTASPESRNGPKTVIMLDSIHAHPT